MSVPTAGLRPLVDDVPHAECPSFGPGASARKNSPFRNPPFQNPSSPRNSVSSPSSSSACRTTRRAMPSE